jgi:hypothetical protein
MLGEWLRSLKEEENEHNTAAASREAQNRHAARPDKKPESPVTRTDKTDKTPLLNLSPDTSRTDKTDKTSEAEVLGLVASWSVEFGFISVHDPTTGEWHDLHWKDAPGWARREARKRKELYGAGNRRAHRLTSREMGEIWAAENPPAEDAGIVEDHPIEGEG